MRILFIGAHYDDVELSAGGTIAKFIADKHEVFINVVTGSDYTTYNGEILREKYEAGKEGIKALTILGVKDYKIKNLGFETKKVPFNSELIEVINRSIDTIKPNLIITHHILTESHQDHINTAKSVMAAARRCNAIWAFESLYPSKLSSIPFHATKYVDVSKYMTQKVESLKAHKSQWEKYPYWEDMILSLGRLRGIEMNCQYAESFEIIKDDLCVR